MAKNSNNVGAISLDDLSGIIIQPSRGAQLVNELPSSRLHLPTVEPLSNRVKILRSESASQSSLPSGSTAAAPNSTPTAVASGPLLQPQTHQQAYMAAFRGTTVRRRANQRLKQSPQQQRDGQEHGSGGEEQQQTSWPVICYRAVSSALGRTYDLVTGFGSGIDDSVSANYGTGVGAFFTIYRQSAMAAVLSAMCVFFFLVFPQIHKVSERRYLEVNNVSRTAAVFGRDIKPQSLLYYGAYLNSTLSGSGYSLSNAYFFTGVAFLLFHLICTAKMLTTAVQEHYVESSGELRSSSLLATVFSSWDFSMRSPRAVAQRRSAIATSFKEMAVQIGRKQRQSQLSERASSILQSLVINLVSLFFMIVNVLLIAIMFKEHIYSRAKEHFSATNLLESSGLYFGSVIIGFHLILCSMRVLSLVEKHKDFRYNVKHPLIRNGLFTLTTVATVAFLLYSLILCRSGHEDADGALACEAMNVGNTPEKGNWTVLDESNPICWESWVAAQLYRLNLYDFFGALVSSFLLEIVPKLLSLLPIAALKKSITLNIDLGYNSASLTFSVSLFWLGAFFSPPLTLMAALKLLLLFFYKWLVLQLCFMPSLSGMGKLLTARTITTFLFLSQLVTSLFMSFLIYSLPMSGTCGPFRAGGTLKDLYLNQSRLAYLPVISMAASGPAQVVLLCLFLTLLVRLRSVALGKEDAIRALKRYIVLENSECVRLNKQINARLRSLADQLSRNQRRNFY